MTELRDPYTADHQRRVGELAFALVAELGWDEACALFRENRFAFSE